MTEKIQLITADPDRGFYWPYYLRRSISDRKAPLIICPNNSGSCDNFQPHIDGARKQVESLGGYLKKFNMLVPVFPRPHTQWRYYTHALNRNTLLADKTFDSRLVRIDLQLLKMIDDATTRVNLADPDKGVIAFGFSASGQFVNRFTVLHPHAVRAVVAGSCGGIMVPLEEFGGETLNFPVGIADIEDLTGAPFDFKSFVSVPHLFLIGEIDDNDPVAHDDGYNETERLAVYSALGAEGDLLRRFRKTEEAFRVISENITFKSYPGVGHNVSDEMQRDIREFILMHND